MKRIITIFFMLGSFSAQCQVQKLFFNNDHRPVKDSTQSTYYILLEKLSDTSWRGKEYQKNNLLLIDGTYRDAKMKVPNGIFTYYDIGFPPGQNQVSLYIESVGYYVNGEKSGQWTTYFIGGQKHTISNYKNGKLNGYYQVFAGKEEVLVDGNYVNDKREGDWHVYDKDGKVTIVDNYVDGKVVNTIRTNTDSTSQPEKIIVISKVETHKKGDSLHKQVLPHHNFNSPIISDASPGCDFKALLTQKIITKVDDDLNEQILLKFMVTYDGKVEKPSIMKGNGSRIDEIIKESAKDFCKWRPASDEQGAVDQIVYCVIKINSKDVSVDYVFSLGNAIKKLN
jgi:antitoxin component YwqK of YwqJK toxin-antitoxin module